MSVFSSDYILYYHLYQYNIQQVRIVEIYAVMTVLASKLTRTVFCTVTFEVIRVRKFPLDFSTQVVLVMHMKPV